MAAEDTAEIATAAQWIARLAAELGVDPITLHTQAAVLNVAREVAHRAERKYAPLVSFVAGRFVEVAARQGRDPERALRDVSEAVARLLADQPPTT